MAVVDEIEVTFRILNQLIGSLSDTVDVEVIVVYAGIADSRAVGTAVVIDKGVGDKSTAAAGTAVESGNAGLHITLSVEQICFTIDFIRSARCEFRRCISVITGSIPITGTIRCGYPGTIGNTSAFKIELDTFVSILIAIKTCKVYSAEIIPFVINSKPATTELTVNGIVILAVNIMKAGSTEYRATIAKELSVININIVIVSGRGNSGTPLYGRITAFAEGSAGVTVLCTGGSLVSKSYRGMNVSRTMSNKIIRIGHAHCLVGCEHFCINVEFLVRECAGGSVCKGNKALINVHLHILCEEVIGSPIGLGCEAGNLNVSIKVNDTNGKLRENCRTSIIVCTGTINSNSCCIGFLVNCISCSESFCKFHVVKLPVVYTVQVNHGFNRLDGFNIGSLEVHPID